jgi:peptidoglycan hydrolase-like protein with peptidoglycan-binding domain
MSLANKIGSAGIAFAFLTTGISVQGFPRNPAGSDSNKQGVATFVTKNEISKMQETLLIKGHYRGKVDGVFGLRTRASIRAYQKAENLPVTGQVDALTADRLGIRPEANWDNSKSAGQEMGHGSDRAVGEIKRDKPSAGIRRAERRTNKTLRKTGPGPESGRGDREKTLQAENDDPQ